jgi:hypothetical protein
LVLIKFHLDHLLRQRVEGCKGVFCLSKILSRSIKNTIPSFLLASFLLITLVSPLMSQSLGSNSTNSSKHNIYDAKGNIVGSLIGSSLAAQQINGFFVGFPIGYSGLKSEAVSLYFSSRDCTGTAYISASDLPLQGKIFIRPEDGSLLNDGIYSDSGVLIFANPPFVTIRTMSILAVSNVSPLSGNCSEVEAKMTALVGSAGTIKLGPYKIPFVIR